MTTVNDIQMSMAIEAVAKRFYQGGVAPDLNEVLSKVSEFFADNPIGDPITLDYSSIFANQPSNVEVVNTIVANIVYNALVLYNTTVAQSQEILMQNTVLRTRLTNLLSKQQRVQGEVQDSLLSLYNTSGYYYTVSDSFADTSKTDLSLTSAFVDTSNNCVTIPSLAALTTVVPSSVIGTPTVNVTAHGVPVNYETISPFSFATHGTTDTVWEIQVALSNPTFVSAQFIVPLGDQSNPLEISRVDFAPYAMVPFQLYAEAGEISTSGSSTYDFTSFGSNIVTSLNRISLTGDAKSVNAFRFTLNKSQYDFTRVSNGVTQYVYIFGAKSIVFSQQTYDTSAVFVSDPLQLYPDANAVIDAVSLEVANNIPPNTFINYFVAADNLADATPNIGDFDWKPIVPVGNTSLGNNVVNFNGTLQFQYMITQDPKGSDLQLLPLDSSNVDLTKRNPNALIMPGVDVYVLADFSQSFLPNSISLEEGVNSTRIYSTPATGLQDLAFWNANIQSPSTSVSYGRIDQGNGFFYGGDVGANGMAVYVETYVDLADQIPPLVGNLVKSDLYSQTWSVKAYLNGTQVAYLPGRNAADTGSGFVPMDSAVVPWNFQSGSNHVALSIYIPTIQQVSNISAPYLGTLQLIQGEDLFSLGTVKLADWSYVSFFDMQYNQSGSPESFTVHNNQIISRRPPTTNYRLSFNDSTGYGPSAIRVRADLGRNTNTPNVSPQMQSYRVRFQYGGK